MKRKDALTDLVEHAQGAEPSEPKTPPSGDRQVVNAQGETITLGQKPRSGVVDPSKAVPLELSEKDWQELAATMRSAINEAVDRMIAQLKERQGK